MKIVLLHVEENEHPNGEAALRLGEIAAKIFREDDVACEIKVRQGNILTGIQKEAESDSGYRFVIIGTHGFKGVREKVFGLDMLHLVKSLPVPVIVLQENSRIPEEGIRKIVFPAGAHRSFSKNVNATIEFSRLFNAEVHLYTVEKSEKDLSDALVDNIRLARQLFETHNIPYRHVTEGQHVYSPGYAKQILKYAGENAADLIAVTALPSQEHFYIADSDKERLLTNDTGIPILFTVG